MKSPENWRLVFGYRISAAAKALPAGGFGGMMETFEMSGVVPFGAGGNLCDVRVLASSCSVNKKPSYMI